MNAFISPSSIISLARKGYPPNRCKSPRWRASALDDVSPSVKFNAVAEALARKQDYESTTRLLSEMSSTGIALEHAALTAIIDSATPSPTHLASFLSKINPTGFSSSPPPIRSEAVSPVDPERMGDISLAVGFLGLVGTCLSAEVLEPPIVHHSADEATTVLIILLTALAFDRYAAAASAWNRIQGGFVRLFTNDTARDARVDAGCFLIAYVLGLPWVCFRPDGEQVVKWLDNQALSYQNETNSDDHKQIATNKKQKTEGVVRRKWTMESTTQLDKYLIWLVSGVATEDDIDGKLISSDLRAVQYFIRKASIRCDRELLGKSKDKEKRIRVAIAQAKDLLSKYRDVHDRLANEMLQGKSVGQCVVIVSDLLSSKTAPT